MFKKLERKLVGLLIILFICFVSIFKPVKIDGVAMEPNYKNGQNFLSLRKFFFIPKRGDVVVYKYPTFPQFNFVGRIVGLPGETIVIQNGDIRINGTNLVETYLSTNKITTTTDKVEYVKSGEYSIQNVSVKGIKLYQEGEEIKIPIDSFFILADNRTDSIDSRGFGPVPKSNITEKLILRYK